MIEFQNSEEIRLMLVTEIREAASRRHLAGINSLVAWFANGGQGDRPEVKGIGTKPLEALDDDLEWIYSPELAEGWRQCSYERSYVKNRRAAQRSAENNHRGNGPKVLRDLLPKF
jgi:hypothetical protein